MHDLISAFFECVHCRRSEGINWDDRLTCVACGKTYECVQGIPVLLADASKQKQYISQSQMEKPDWYQAVQLSETASPWRHPLQKRRSYVEASLQRYMAGKHITSVPAILDAGCGDGNHLGYLQSYGENIFGSDYNLTRLLRARERSPKAHLFLADILDYPAIKDYFDIIFFNHVLEHIPDDAGALQSIYRILKPGGLLILGVPNEGAAWWQLAYTLQPSSRATTDHVHFYTADSLTQMMRTIGFIVQEVEYLGWGPPHWRLDTFLRRSKLLDDLFEYAGKNLIREQASSLYLLATKE